MGLPFRSPKSSHRWTIALHKIICAEGAISTIPVSRVYKLCFTMALAMNQKQFVNRPSSRRYAMVKLSVLSALSEGSPGRFPSQRAGNAEPSGKHRQIVKKMYALWKWRWTDSVRVTHICVGNSWRNMSSRSLIVTGLDNISEPVINSAPSHYLNKCWLLANKTSRNKGEILKKNHTFLLTEFIWKCRPQNEHFSWPQCFHIFYNVVGSCPYVRCFIC